MQEIADLLQYSSEKDKPTHAALLHALGRTDDLNKYLSHLKTSNTNVYAIVFFCLGSVDQSNYILEDRPENYTYYIFGYLQPHLNKLREEGDLKQGE